LRLSLQALRRLMADLLQLYRVPLRNAQTIADVLAEADATGVASHGVARLPSCLRRVKSGLMNPDAQPRVVAETATQVRVDGGNGFGQVAACFAVDCAVRKAAQHGMALAAVFNSNHFGIAGYYTRRMARAGLIGFAFSNAAPAMAPYGGTRPLLGSNPLSIAVPAPEAPIVLDISMTVVARGKIRRAAREGKPIPEGWAVDASGLPTTDPQAALKGSLLPVGAHKGYGLAVMVDLLSGVLSGGSFLDDVAETTSGERPCGTCFTFMAVSPDGLLPKEEFLRRVGEFQRRLRGVPPAPGVVRVLLPGDVEQDRLAEAERGGVEVAQDVLKELAALYQEAGSSPPAELQQALAEGRS